jgi:hypothetical protein
MKRRTVKWHLLLVLSVLVSSPGSTTAQNGRGGRPRIESELRTLIRQMSTENQLWGAPRIHGELLKLGFSVA